MALFETMRENTKVVLWITVVAFVGLIFLAWGADFSTRGSAGRSGEAGVVAKVNGQRVSWAEYSDAIQQSWAAYEQQVGRRPDQAAELQIQAQVWDNLITQALLRQEAQRRGITVTDREVAIALANNPPARFQANAAFHTDGRFDIQKYQSYIADPRTNTLPLEREQRDLVATEKLRLMLFAQIKVSENEVRDTWLEDHQTCSFDYAAIPYAQIQLDADQIGDAELEAYLQSHAGEFRRDTRVILEHVRINKTLSATDSLDARTEIEDAYRETQRGEDFDTIVLMYSEAAASRRGGDQAAFLTRGQISQPEVAAAAFSQPIGQPGEILSSRDGFHILRVDAREEQDGQEKVKLAEVFVPLVMSMDTNIGYRDRMIDLADSAAVVGFAEMAEREGLTVNRTAPFDRESFVPGLLRIAAASEFAKSAKVGEISKPIETADAWYLLHLAELLPPAMPKLEEVRDRVRGRYLNAQRKARATELAEAILDEARRGAALEEATASQSLATFASADSVKLAGFVSGLGTAPEVTGTALGHGPGLVPYVLNTQSHAIVLSVRSISEVDEAALAEARDQTEALLLRQKQNQALTSWLETLRTEAKIEDFRFSVASL